MIRISEHMSDDGVRYCSIWQDGEKWSVLFFENEKLIHTVNIPGTSDEVETLAEDFVLGKKNPTLLVE